MLNCDGHPCLVGAKSDAQTLCVDPALSIRMLTLLTNAYVSRLETDATGRSVKAVHVEHNGQQETTRRT